MDYGLKFTFHESWKLERTFHHVVGHFPLIDHRHFTGYFLPRFTHPHAQIHFFLFPRGTNSQISARVKQNWLGPGNPKTPFTEWIRCSEKFLASLCLGNKLGVGRHTSYSERSRQRTGSPRVLSTPFHAFTGAREARLWDWSVRQHYQIGDESHSKVA